MGEVSDVDSDVFDVRNRHQPSFEYIFLKSFFTSPGHIVSIPDEMNIGY